MAAPAPAPAADRARRTPATRRTASHPVRYALLGVVVLIQAFAAVQRRWVQEDGFINIRIAQQVVAGNGPVFNAGERVEAFTSPLWLAILVVLRVLTGGLVPYEWLAVGAGIVLSLAGTALLLLGAVALWTPTRARTDRVWWIPLGILVPLALPPFWDFATSGLETALAWGWVGAAFAALTTAIRAQQRARLDLGSEPRLTARYVLIGLGPLVRPEMALYSIALGLGLLLLVDQHGGRAREVHRWWARGLIAWLAAPLLYQLFRMGYFGSLVPNTALAKNAGASVWGRGVSYLDNFAGTYLLVLPALVLVTAVALTRVRRVQSWAIACTAAPALVHGLYVVWVGGDYMHGRFWLIPVLALIAPFSALPLLPAAAGRRRAVAPVCAGLIAVWGIAAASSWRPPPLDKGGAIDDQRALVVAYLGDEHPVRLSQQPDILLDAGALLEGRAGDDVYLDVQDPMKAVAVELPRPEGSGTAAQYAAIGVTGVRSGLDVSFVDSFGLADPIAARTPAVSELRAGHTHSLPDPWRKARAGVTSDDPGVRAAEQAQGCGDLKRLLDASEAPMTPGRFLSNLFAAPRNTTLEVPADPAEAVRRFCGTG